MKKKRPDGNDERRRERVEINLLTEEQGGRGPVAKVGRGCAVPFSLLVLALAVCIEVLRPTLG